MLIDGTTVADLEEKLEQLENDYVTLAEENEALAEGYGYLREQLKLTHGILAILIEEQGGIIEMDKQLLLNYNSEGVNINGYEDVAGEKFVIEVSIEGYVIDDTTV